MDIGKRIKALMRERRVSAKEISLETGIPQSTIAQWCNYDQEPKADALVKLAKYFSVSIEYLITGEHPEASAAKEIFEGLEKHFVSVHTGVYRINIERQIEIPLTRRSKQTEESKK